MPMDMEHRIPVIDISALIRGGDVEAVARKIREACMVNGFFYVSGHGVPLQLQQELERVSSHFFSLPAEKKMRIAMQHGGRAWRGFFPVGAELTSGKPDQKEGLYFGTELNEDDPKVKAGTPLHGQNLFPTDPEGMRDVVLRYMQAVTDVGHAIMKGIALSLGLPSDHFEKSITHDPFILFRIFHYPPQTTGSEVWGVGEHTDYGLLTILKQDNIGGLQVRSSGHWIEAPPIANTFVCNIGDMLDRMTGGLYRSTPHRVLNVSGKERYSFPLFFDPAFDCVVKPVPGLSELQPDHSDRWDQEDVYGFEGKYGDYLVRKVSRVFPSLFREI